MENITMLEMRKNAGGIIRRIKRGERMILFYRGKPVVRLEPISKNNTSQNDSFFSMSKISLEDVEILDNRKMDSLVYEK